MGIYSKLSKIGTGNRSGVGIVEAMFGVVIVGMTALAMIQMSSISGRMTKDAHSANDFNALANEIRGLIAVEQTCRLMIGGPTTYNGPDTARSQTWVNNMGVYFYTPKPDGTGPIIVADPTALPAPIIPDNQIWNEWTFTEVKLTDDPGQTSFPNMRAVVVLLTATRTVEGGLKTRGTALIRMTIELRAGRIVSCQNVNYGTDYSNTPVCATDEALVTYGGRPVCRRVRCPVGQRITGYDALGNVTCAP